MTALVIGLTVLVLIEGYLIYELLTWQSKVTKLLTKAVDVQKKHHKLMERL